MTESIHAQHAILQRKELELRWIPDSAVVHMATKMFVRQESSLTDVTKE